MKARILVAIAFLAAGLAVLPGCVYANIKAPLDTDLDETTLGSKVGVANVHSILNLVAWGDGGTQAAAEQGGIETIHHADQQILSVLFFAYVRRTTIVYGD
ncbi:MAG: hypothetical protein JXP34_28495 [Planctomycetes bacterium]|nr:hypothetical protein [Planctomycetota bacterium]